MRQKNRFFIYFWAFVAGSPIIFLAPPAHAYLDAGTGSMLLQLIIGGVAGLLMAIKLYWRHILVKLGIKKEAPDSSPPDSGEPE